MGIPQDYPCYRTLAEAHAALAAGEVSGIVYVNSDLKDQDAHAGEDEE